MGNAHYFLTRKSSQRCSIFCNMSVVALTDGHEASPPSVTQTIHCKAFAQQPCGGLTLPDTALYRKSPQLKKKIP